MIFKGFHEKQKKNTVAKFPKNFHEYNWSD